MRYLGASCGLGSATESSTVLRALASRLFAALECRCGHIAWPPDKRLAPIALGAAIVASNDRFDIQGDPLRELEPTVARLHSSALESVTTAQWSATDFISLLQAVRAFEGDHVWGHHLNHLVDGEFITTCAQCGVDLYVVIGEGGCFATAEDWVRNRAARRELIEPSRDRLPEVGEWLRTRANAAGQRTLAAQLPYLFGRTQCPSCGQPLDVAATISQLS